MIGRQVSFWGKTMVSLNILVAMALGASYLSVFIDPKDFWQIAFFGLAFPFLVVLNAFFIFFWIIYTRWWFLLSFVMIISGYSYLRQTVSLHFNNTERTDTTERCIRVMTFNAHFFKTFDGPLKAVVKTEMLEMISRQKPDIICFQEFFSRKKGDFNIRDSLFKIMHSRHYFFHPADSNNYEGYGIAIFSKYPITGDQYIRLSTERNSVNGAIIADIQLPGRLIRVFSIQLQSIKFGSGDYEFIDRVKTDVNPDMHSSRIIGHKLKWAFIRRSDQAKLIADKIAQSPYPVIVCGDFNDPPVSFAFQTVSSNLQNCFAEKGRGFARTYNGSFPNFQIDYILCSPMFGVLNYKIVKKELSDHYPVISELSYH